MKKVSRKSPRPRLDSTSYTKLQRQVLERDGWRCQVCGSMQHLQVHHLRFRSQSGGDEEQNLITLCADCHEQVHQPSKLSHYVCREHANRVGGVKLQER